MRSGTFGCADLVRAGSVIAAATIGLSPAHAQDAAAPTSDLTVSLGGSLWHGDYGAPTDTSIYAALLGVRYRVGGLRVSAYLPRMWIKSDGTIFAGIGGTPLFAAPSLPTGGKRLRKGFGDLTLGASYLLPNPSGKGVDVELTGRVKLPTASDSSRLSTGKTDYSGGVDVSKTVGRLTPHVSATYRVFGDRPGLRFRDSLDVVAGAAYALPGRVTLIGQYEYFQRATRLIGDSHELLVGASAPVGSRFRLSGYASAGLSQGASDVTAGASVSVTF